MLLADAKSVAGGAHLQTTAAATLAICYLSCLRLLSCGGQCIKWIAIVTIVVINLRSFAVTSSLCTGSVRRCAQSLAHAEKKVEPQMQKEHREGCRHTEATERPQRAHTRRARTFIYAFLHCTAAACRLYSRSIREEKVTNNGRNESDVPRLQYVRMMRLGQHTTWCRVLFTIARPFQAVQVSRLYCTVQYLRTECNHGPFYRIIACIGT